jgi:DNA-binding XRE family transcriptional regulator
LEGGQTVRIDRIKLVTELTRRDMTQKKLAELAGISRITVNYIKGGKSCSDDVGNKIAAALQIPIEKLLEK